MEAVQGIDKLRAKLASIAGAGGGNDKLVRAAVGASMRVMAKAQRNGINASQAGPVVKAAARELVGSRFAKSKKDGQIAAKVGLAVGSKGKKKAKEKLAATLGGFVSANSIHLFVMGTKDRWTGPVRYPSRQGKHYVKRPAKERRYTGRMMPQLYRVISAASQNATSEALQAAAQKARQILQQQALAAKG